MDRHVSNREDRQVAVSVNPAVNAAGVEALEYLDLPPGSANGAQMSLDQAAKTPGANRPDHDGQDVLSRRIGYRANL
jgi:hypothetical protein